jgi:protein TilB
MAEQKEEEDKKKRENEPPKRDYEKEHQERLERIRDGEEKVRQKNEGNWEFSIDDEDGDGNVVLRLSLPRFLDSSLLDVDIHPNHVTVVVKGKVFRIKWTDEVKSDSAKAQRSSTTGELVITAPKVRPNLALQRLRKEQKEAKEEGSTDEQKADGKKNLTDAPERRKKKPPAPKLADLMLQEGQQSEQTVDISERETRRK